MPLRILHISDIHFHSVSAAWDEDSDLRSELVRDVSAWVRTNGAIDAVLVGGDIAFSARADEYEIALKWIDAILEAGGGLDRSRVWTVPGNHDVDWNVVRASHEAASFREEMRSCGVEAIDDVFRRRVANDPTSDGLIAPLAEYNRFAEHFLCTTETGRLAWADRSLSVDGWKVRLTGINSVLNSGPEDEHNVLAVGAQQCKLPREQDTIHIAMLHHPSRWIRDWQLVEPYLNRAHVLLFGHEHAYQAEQRCTGGTVRVSAGAVAPERGEAGEQEPFIPTYNFLTLTRVDDQLRVEVNPRYWSLTGTRFAEHPGGSQCFLVDADPALPATPAAGLSVADEVAPSTLSPVGEASPLIEDENALTEAATPQEKRSLRAVGVEFLNMPVFKRLDIARALGVITDEDLQLSPATLYPLLLQRVRESAQIDELISEMKK